MDKANPLLKGVDGAGNAHTLSIQADLPLIRLEISA